VLVQQQAAERAEKIERSVSAKAGKRALQRHSSVRGPMLSGDMLWRAFRVFDQEGKGYVSVNDLQRVLNGHGLSGVGGDWMAGATDGDREGRRVTYGSFVRLMSHTVKRAHAQGEYLFKQGDEVRDFYCLLSGEVEVVRHSGRYSEQVLNTLRAGEYFGENSLLEGAKHRSVSIRCATPVEVLTLSKADFEAGFGKHGGAIGDGSGSSSAADDELRAKLLSFIRMVSPQHKRTVAEGDDVFRQGDAADRFHILASGKLVVRDGGTMFSGPRTLGEIRQGEGFGESSLLLNKPKRTKNVTCVCAGGCEVVEIVGTDFKRLLEKSRVVRESFERLDSRRTAQNAETAAKGGSGQGGKA